MPARRTTAHSIVASCVAAAFAATAGMAHAQIQGFAVGTPVVWQKPDVRLSDFKPGAYAGTIERIDGSGVLTLINRKAQWVKVRLDQLTTINCTASEKWTLDPTGGGPKTYSTCLFEGGVQGPFAIYDWGSGLTVRLTEPVALKSGKVSDVYRSGLDDFGALKVGVGHNQWAAKPGSSQDTKTTIGTSPGTTAGGSGTTGTTSGGSATTGTTTGGTGPGTSLPTSPPPPGGVVSVTEVGQGYAQALKVGYPAILQAQMGAQDYDTVLFDFPGGPFHAHTKSQLNLVADLLDAQGKMIARVVGGNLQFNETLPAGRYGIIVRVMNYAGTGPYELVLGSGAGTTYRERQ